jgi:energy-coupling factor transport system substrate-specific component
MSSINETAEKKKLGGKDLITIGIYTALYIVAMLVACVMMVTPITYMFYPAGCALLGAVFVIMLSIKVKKFGAIIIFGVIVGLLLLATGMPTALPCIIVTAIIGQFIVSAGKYESFWADTFAYVLISIGAIGGYMQLFAAKSKYLEGAKARGLSDSFIDGLDRFATPGFLVVMILAVAVAAILGCAFSKVILKKHLIKAGVV